VLLWVWFATFLGMLNSEDEGNMAPPPSDSNLHYPTRFRVVGTHAADHLVMLPTLHTFQPKFQRVLCSSHYKTNTAA
jgi:hypothetical protein